MKDYNHKRAAQEQPNKNNAKYVLFIIRHRIQFLMGPHPSVSTLRAEEESVGGFTDLIGCRCGALVHSE